MSTPLVPVVDALYRRRHGDGVLRRFATVRDGSPYDNTSTWCA
jgi:hypothetical protein